MAEASRVLVRCRVARGFFASERLVMLGKASVFASRSQVELATDPPEGEAADGQVVGFLIHRTGDRALVELPGDAVVGGLRSWVPASDVARAPTNA
jgi:hypothetical protein